MKYIILILSLIFFNFQSQAQGRNINSRQNARSNNNLRQESRPRLSTEQRTYIKERNNVLKEKLDLSNSQRQKYDQLKRETRSKVMQIKNDDKLTKEEKKQKFHIILKDAKMKRNEILTPEQRKIMKDELEFRNIED